MDVTSAILYLRSRETLQLQHVVHVEEVTACEHSHLKSPSRNKSDDSPFTMATSLYDIRLVLPFLQLVFQHSGNRDIKIFTMKPRRVMAIYHLYINLLPQYGHISDTIKIIQLLLENYPTQRLETILGGKTIRTMQTQYIQKLGIQCFSQPLHWRWLVANILLYLKASEVAKLCTVCKRWKSLIFSTPTWNYRLLSAEQSCVSIFREVLRQGGLSGEMRIKLYCHELSPRVLGGHGRPIISKINLKTMSLRYAHAKSALELVVRKGSVNISSPVEKGKGQKVDFHAAAALIDEDVRRTFGVSKSKVSLDDEYKNDRMKKMECLRNVLRSYVCQNNNVGYCQGMDYVVSFLLEQSRWNEAVAFSLLDLLMEERKLNDMFSIGLPGLQKRFHQFDVLMAMHAPDLTMHFEKEQIDSTMFATNWFMTLFTDYKLLYVLLVKLSVLTSIFTNCQALISDFCRPKQVVVRVFDLFVVDGWPVIMSVALAIMKELEPYLLLLDMEGIMKFIKNVSLDSSSMDVTTNNSPIIFDDAKKLLAKALVFGITGQLLESIAESELQESVNLNATDKFGDRQLVQSPSNKTSSTDAIPQDTKNNFMGNIIKKNWPPAFLSSYLNGQSTVTTGTKNKHKQHNPKRMQTPSSVFRSGSIFSKKKEVDSYNINRVSTPL